jgi:serine/threonine protein kinase
MGTVGYMSPEQVRAKSVDHRSDIFSFGTVLYEMISGRRAFQRDSAIESLNAILKEEPADFGDADGNISPALERVVLHCLEKNPDRRFQSATDVVFALESLSGVTSHRSQQTMLGSAICRRIVRPNVSDGYGQPFVHFFLLNCIRLQVFLASNR